MQFQDRSFQPEETGNVLLLNAVGLEFIDAPAGADGTDEAPEEDFALSLEPAVFGLIRGVGGTTGHAGTA